MNVKGDLTVEDIPVFERENQRSRMLSNVRISSVGLL